MSMVVDNIFESLNDLLFIELSHVCVFEYKFIIDSKLQMYNF